MGEDNKSSEERRGKKGGEDGKWRKRKKNQSAGSENTMKMIWYTWGERQARNGWELISELCWKEADRSHKQQQVARSR